MSEQRTELSVGQLVGNNLREERQRLGLTQEEGVHLIRGAGLSWTRDQIASFESGRRQEITLGELVLLSEAFEVPLARWFKDFEFPGYRWGEDHGPKIVRLSAGVLAELAELQELLQGARAGGERGGLVRRAPNVDRGAAIGRNLTANEASSAIAYSRAESRAAAGLGSSLQEVRATSQRLWDGRTLDQERERRLGDRAPSNRSAVRGHVTRSLLNELRPTFKGASRQGRRTHPTTRRT